MLKIEFLDKTSFDTLYTTFNEAFGSYEVQVNMDELRVMLKRRGFVPELSFGAFENNNLVSFTLNGIGYFNRQHTAYDTGTGTIEAFRGKGIGSALLNETIRYNRHPSVKAINSEITCESMTAFLESKNIL